MGKKSKKAILEDQRPKKSYFRMRAFFRMLVFGFAVLGLSVTGIFAYKSFKKNIFAGDKLNNPTKVDWRVTLKTLDNQDESLPEDVYNKIIGLVRKNLGTGNHESLEKVAEIIQAETAFARVHVLKTAYNAVVVSFERRRPVLSVEVAGVRRFVSEDGVVYGVASNQSPLPQILGIFPNRYKNFEYRRDQSLVMNESERTAIKEAIDLYLLGQKSELAMQSVKYEEYRGFLIVLSQEDTEVFIGRAPFEEKMRRLQTILQNLTKKGTKAARIELDYTGKAFVREKKL